jgi:hypothetical protein
MAFEIPAAIQTLLKNLEMTDNNRPNAEFLVSGAPPEYGGVLDWTTFRTLRGTEGVHWSGGSFVKLDNGRRLVTYQKKTPEGFSKIYLSYVDTEEDIFFSDNEVTAEEWEFITLRTASTPQRYSTLKKITNGDLLLFVLNIGEANSDPVEHNTLKVYKSANGLGTDFTELATIYDYDMAWWATFGAEAAGVGHVLQLPTGRILVPFVAMRNNFGNTGGARCAYSDDNGVTWTVSVLFESWYILEMLGFGKLGDQLMAVCGHYSGGGFMYFIVSDDWGETWTALERKENAPGGVMMNSQLFWGETDGYTYWAYRQWTIDGLSTGGCKIYRRLDSLALSNTGQDPYDLDNWEEAYEEDVDGGGEVLWTTEDGNLAFCGTKINYEPLMHPYEARILGGIRSKVSIPIKSVVVDRSKGGASQAVVIIDNTGGTFAPDSIGPWAHILWFNKSVQIKLGYGATRQLVFTGLIDTINMTTYPPEITIKSRDYSKLALDQQPQDDYYEGYAGEPRYAFTYWNKTPEYIFGDMATQAGWASGTVHADVTGITLGQFDSGHEKVADCFQRLCELTGWEWFTDESGHVYFRAARDPNAVKVYTFTEGVDIFSLGYDLDDEELYYTIVVWSGDENRDVIKASGVWPAAVYNNVLPKKTMIVNASDIVTDQAGAEAMVLALSNGMTPKVREVNFVAVGNPYLQIGDVVQVIESTTWTSEHYRITEISHQMNSQGTPIFGTGLKCYHFAYGE